MVWYFRSLSHPHLAVIYMPSKEADKTKVFEAALPDDLWFGSKEANATDVYLRLKTGTEMDSLPKELLEEVAQLVKAYSPEGSKKKEISVIYTPVSNISKRHGIMHFKDRKNCRLISNVSRDSTILNLLRKTKTETPPEVQDIYIAKTKKVARPKTAEKIKSLKREATGKKSMHDIKLNNKKNDVE